jgi:hypothetical protein
MVVAEVEVVLEWSRRMITGGRGKKNSFKDADSIMTCTGGREIRQQALVMTLKHADAAEDTEKVSIWALRRYVHP